MKVESGGGMMAGMNVTPLIDVVLVLLIIFMLVTPLTQRGYDVKVPQKATVQPPRQTLLGPIVVRYTAEKRIFINGEEIPPERLATRLRKLMTGRPDKLAFFAGDRGLNYQVAVRFMDRMRASGVEKLAIAPAADELPDPAASTSVGEDRRLTIGLR